MTLAVDDQPVDERIYTIGWICALHTEYTAARAFLDEKRTFDSKVPQDNNEYTLGRVEKHNVVVAVCPDSEYGIAAAATVARDLVRSFPNVRLGLMVGVGGGVPSSRHDVRLGDVVVSCSAGNIGAVVQYDMGRKLQDGTFQIVGQLDNPPTALRTAISGLRSKHEEEGNGIRDMIEGALASMRKQARRKYSKPSDETDVLYEADFVHPQGRHQGCSEICAVTNENVVQRETRDEEDDIPAVHYGPLGSGNSVMKDAITRDHLHRVHGILCFEMEAAGLMNHWPCLVIRGICDYSDSHKNQQWQGYAALSAAAYARSLLLKLAQSQIEATDTISHILKSQQDSSERLQRVEQHLTTLVFGQVHTECLDWLNPSDPSLNFNAAREKRHATTGNWLLESEVFTEWQSNKASFLWLNGMAGCGKTVLSSTVLSRLAENDPEWSRILYYYFDFADQRKQTLEHAVRTLVHQLAGRREANRRLLQAMWRSHSDGERQPTLEALCTLLDTMVQHHGEIWIVLDALDECTTLESKSGRGLLRWLEAFIKAHENIHVVVTSRPEAIIGTSLRRWAPDHVIVSIQNDAVTNDINAYVKARLIEDRGFQRWRRYPDVQREIELSLVRKANGMFRWVSCQIEELRQCLDRPQLEEALRQLPDDLYTTYDRILFKIPTRLQDKTFRLLQILVFSERPLLVGEAVDAIAVVTGKNPVFDTAHRLPDPEDIEYYCSSLVSIEDVDIQYIDSSRGTRSAVSSSSSSGSDSEDGVSEGSIQEEIESVDGDSHYSGSSNAESESQELRYLRLAHFSVQEYLTSNQLRDTPTRLHFEEQLSHALLAEICLIYLLHLEASADETMTRRHFPFAQYCAEFWWVHFRQVQTPRHSLIRLARSLFASDAARSTWLDLLDPKWHPFRNVGSRLYIAASCGMSRLVEEFLALGDPVDAKGGWFGNPFTGGVLFEEPESILITPGRSAEASLEQKSPGFYPQEVIFEGPTELERELLDSIEAYTTSVQRLHGNALQIAAHEGYHDVVRILLDNGAEIHAQGGGHGNALLTAITNGQTEATKILLDRSAESDAQDRRYSKTQVLKTAVYWDREEIVRLLLDNDADDTTRGGRYSNALLYAMKEEIVELLLDHGADINFQSEGGETALMRAAEGGETGVVKLLLARGADIHIQGGQYGNALQAAANAGNIQEVRLLLNNGALVNTQGGEHGSALLAAAASYGTRDNEKVEMVKLLLEKGADVNAQSGKFGSALQAAATSYGKEYFDLVELLLEKGADVNASGGKYGNALQAAAYNARERNEETVKLLLDKGADINASGGKFGSALQAAAAPKYRKDKIKVVELLLDRGADVNAQGGKYGNALQAATVKEGMYGNPRNRTKTQAKVIKLLLDWGANLFTMQG